MNPRYIGKVVETKYWLPGGNHLKILAEALDGKICDGDIVTISEKALSIVKGRIINESEYKSGLLARFISKIWMRIIWGYFLCQLCHMKEKNIRRLREYPLKEGSVHKQIVMSFSSFLQVLQWGSEGGIDGSNLPDAFVSLPLDNPQETTEEIRNYIKNRLGKEIAVMIVDTDKTYSILGFHFTHRPSYYGNIHSFLGFIG
jgi:F420-0:gamma-glutamyl ligase-like protein